MVARIWEQTRNLDNGVTERAKLGGIWGQTRCLGAGRANRGTDTMPGIAIRNV